MQNLRLFFAIDLPLNIKQKLITIAKQNKTNDWRLVGLNNLHITILFLGEINPEFLKDIINAGQEIIVNFSSPKLIIKNVSYGPIDQTKRHDMIWANLENNHILEILKTSLEKVLSEKQIPFRSDYKKFNPHITLARLNKESLPPQGKFTQEIDDEFIAKEMVLMLSEATPYGRQYTPIQTFPFNDQ